MQQGMGIPPPIWFPLQHLCKCKHQGQKGVNSGPLVLQVLGGLGRLPVGKGPHRAWWVLERGQHHILGNPCCSPRSATKQRVTMDRRFISGSLQFVLVKGIMSALSATL